MRDQTEVRRQSLAPEDVDAFFEAVNATCQDESGEQIVPALRRRFEKPPCSLLNLVLGGYKTDDEVRRLLFAPTAADIQVYVNLLIGDPQNPTDLTDNAANKAQVLALTHLFLVHGRAWRHMRPFIEAGGLRALVNLLNHPNRLLGSQAMHLLLLATHPGMYDWNNPQTHQHGATPSELDDVNSSNCSPPSLQPHMQQPQQQQQQQHPAHGPDSTLWLQLAGLHDSVLLPSLMLLSPDVWPGSGAQAVQLMVFYLTWLRTWWSKDGALQLSQSMLDGLSAWSTRTTASSIEQQLAAQLLADFGRAGPAAAANHGGADFGSRVVAFKPRVELRVTADRTQVNSCPGSEAARLKAAGNAAFQAKDWATAIQMYSAALDVPVPAAALIYEAARRAVYHTNRAAAYLERVCQLEATAAKSNSSSSNGNHWCEVGGLLDGLHLDGSSESVTRQLDAAVMDCRSAIDLVPNHVKAHYRLAAALKAKGDLKAAAAAAMSAQQHASSAADRAATTKLAAAIQQQQAKENSRPIVLTAKKRSCRDVNNFEHAGVKSSMTGRVGDEQSTGGKTVAAADPLGQLLQEFETAVCQAAEPAPITLSAVGRMCAKSADVIETLRLPGDLAGQQRDKCSTKSNGRCQLQAKRQQGQPMKQQAGQLYTTQPTCGNRRVFVEVLASSDNVERTSDKYHYHDHNSNLVDDDKVCLDDLVEMLD